LKRLARRSYYLKLHHDPQRRRYFGHVLLTLGSSPEQPSKLPPGEFWPVLGWQAAGFGLLLDVLDQSRRLGANSLSGNWHYIKVVTLRKAFAQKKLC
jgi:hypothetical protein